MRSAAEVNASQWHDGGILAKVEKLGEGGSEEFLTRSRKGLTVNEMEAFLELHKISRNGDL